MTDPRVKDAVRNTEVMVAGMKLEIEALKEDIKTLTTMVRDVKRSVVRKYGDKKEND